ncbi:hypothetical protein BGZ90_000762 [Linnemannia elongata]|nr:hypothetical protein BGZ90_000762 [Linnemannia elongata]
MPRCRPLYGAYKQATKGDVKGLKPTFFDITARSKWQAWANMRGKTQDEAKAVYVDLVVKVDHSIRSVATGGIHSAAASVYELASEQPFDTEVDTTPATTAVTTTTTDSTKQPSYHEITETVVEEEILDDDEYADEIQKVTMASPTSSQPPSSPFGQQQQHGKDGADADDEEEEDDVYQSSEEYDDDDDRGSALGSVRSSTEIQPTTVTATRQQQQEQQVKDDDFVDEGVFDEEEKDELDADIDDPSRFKLGAPAPVAEFEKHAASLPLLSSGLHLVGVGQDKALGSPVVEPYRVNVVHETPSTPQPVPPTTVSPHAHAGAGEEAVCPVSKKTASSGGVCPAAMFAQARAAAAAASAKADEGASEPQHSTHSSPGPIPTVIDEQAEPLDNTTHHQRAATEPAPSVAPASSSSSTSSAVTAATNQGKRIGQGIVNRFTALRSSLAAASARAASSALSGGTSSSTPRNKNSVVVKDPITNQSVTIESLKIKSQTRAQERRSARGILKLVLRQGLINAVLLLIVFAVLYKRKSPIAFAILAYVGQGAKEGEAGWRALMRWSADVVRTGQRNQALMLRAGRRNGYW